MNKSLKAIVPLAVLGAQVLLPAAASASPSNSGATTTYRAHMTPVPLNGQKSASGTLTLKLHGNQATIHEQVSGVAKTFMNAPFPHVQHIHGGAMGTCPTASADANHDGVINTPEAQPNYGPIQTTLSVKGDTSPAAGTNVKIAPSGSSFTYDRTITLDAATLKSIRSGIAVIVVHGLDPATAPKAATTEKSPLVPSLPLAATAPAICGSLKAAQVSHMPKGGAATGSGSTQSTHDAGLLAAGGGLLAAAGGAWYLRRRRTAA
ncbi:hypothetical protein [Streptomyces montanisoli]|uniref:CHRD domain-containing protein n=1 Tax=Streptomyces montanisoli TaxID=2798581 RepID=A0A940M8D3_9ACTN|nr:hypothetical protein [Streptomyces montanisoli]MBP0456664.1 hypothetical protein [Streptomyces montanisoli]